MKLLCSRSFDLNRFCVLFCVCVWLTQKRNQEVDQSEPMFVCVRCTSVIGGGGETIYGSIVLPSQNMASRSMLSQTTLTCQAKRLAKALRGLGR